MDGGSGGLGVGRSGGDPGVKAIHSQCGGGGLGQKLRMKITSGLSEVGGNRIGCDGWGLSVPVSGVSSASPVMVAFFVVPSSMVITALLIVICIFSFRSLFRC